MERRFPTRDDFARTAAPILATGIGFALIVYLSCRPWNLHDGPMIAAPFGRDFVNFWTGGRLALQGSLATLTDFDAYNRLIAGWFGHTRDDALMFSYPPHALLVLAPLAFLPYTAALIIWTVANLLALAWTTRRLAPRRHRHFLIVAASLSPAALMMVLYGHFGGLMALAIAIVVLDGEKRPVVAGFCLAALTVKPQFATLLGLILLGAGRWRCLPVAALCTVALLLLSAALFGVDVWRGFLTVTMPEQSAILADNEAGMLHTTISVFFAATTLHVPATLAWMIQGIVTVAALVVGVLSLRRGDADVLVMLAVPLAMVVALPYANHYDLAIAAPALTILLMEHGTDSRAGISRLLAWLVPPLAWHMAALGIPLVPAATAATLFEPAFDAKEKGVDRSHAA